MGDGSLGERATLALVQTGTGVMTQIGAGPGTGALVTVQAPDSNDLIVYRMDPGGGLSLVRSNQMGTDAVAYTLLAEAPVAGRRGLVALSQTQDSIAAFRMSDNGTLTQTGLIGATNGLGIAAPTAMSVTQSGGRDFVIVGSAGSGSLSVLELMADGSLVARDDLLDERDTRFAGVQAVEAITVDGWTNVLAGGSDDGVSLFLLLPDGRLQPLDHVEQQTGWALADVRAIAVTVAGAPGATHLQAYVAGEDTAAISRFSLDLSRRA